MYKTEQAFFFTDIEEGQTTILFFFLWNDKMNCSCLCLCPSTYWHSAVKRWWCSCTGVLQTHEVASHRKITSSKKLKCDVSSWEDCGLADPPQDYTSRQIRLSGLRGHQVAPSQTVGWKGRTGAGPVRWAGSYNQTPVEVFFNSFLCFTSVRKLFSISVNKK